MAWVPLGKLVLVKLHSTGSSLVLGDDVKYKASGDVLGVGREVEQEIAVGDTVLINGAQALIGHPDLGEGIAVIPSAFLLARREEKES